MSGRLYRGWIIVGGAFVVLFLAYGTQYAFGVFFAALLAEFHWSRASLSGAFSLYAFVYSAFGLIAGRLTDRWGPRVVIAGGGFLLGAGLAGMSLVTALWQPYVLYGGVAALVMSTAYVPCNATVVRWFVRRRGLAVGLASAGGSVGTFVLPPVAHWLVSGLGWRRAYVVFGAAIFLGLAGVPVVTRRDPESLGLHPDGAMPTAPAGPIDGWTSFATLALATGLPGLLAAAIAFGFSYGTVSTLFPAMVADFFGRAHAGAVVGLLFGLAGPTAALGPVGAGWIYDRFGGYGPAWWLSAGVTLAALALLGFARAPSIRERADPGPAAHIDRAAVAR